MINERLDTERRSTKIITRAIQTGVLGKCYENIMDDESGNVVQQRDWGVNE